MQRMIRTIRKIHIATLAFMILAQGCGHSRLQEDLPLAEDPNESGVEIVYLLGHHQHRISVTSRAKKQENENDHITVKSFLGKEILEEAPIDREKYTDFLQKTQEFVSAQQAAADSSCRTPYTVTLRVGKDIKSITGCRSADSGAFSRLVRQGEFLLYSKK